MSWPLVMYLNKYLTAPTDEMISTLMCALYLARRYLVGDRHGLKFTHNMKDKYLLPVVRHHQLVVDFHVLFGVAAEDFGLMSSLSW